MLYQTRLQHVQITAPKAAVQELIGVLAQQHSLHISNKPKWLLRRGEEPGQPLSSQPELLHQLALTRELLAALGERRVASVMCAEPANLAERLVLIDAAVRGTTDAALRVQQMQHQKKHVRPQNITSIAELRKEHGAFLLQAERYLARAVEHANVARRFTFTKAHVQVTGWVPAERRGALEKAVSAIPGAVLCEQATLEESPVRMREGSFLSAYDLLLRMYTLPRPSEIDPTLLVFLSFPIFFGFMLGDVGYGLLLLVFAFFLLRVKAPLRVALGRILLMSAGATILFGLLYGEFFGQLSVFGIVLPHVLDRERELVPLLMVAISIGVLHIALALLIGFINECRFRGGVHAFLTKMSWLLVLVALIILAHAYFLGFAVWTLGYCVFAFGVVLLFFGEGVRALFELPSLVSNVVSYARLMAIGVASAALALVINNIAHTLFHKGSVVLFVLAVLVLLFGHVLNLFLGMFGAFVHSLRLHYVEFFGKFYRGGAKPYRPFGAVE